LSFEEWKTGLSYCVFVKAHMNADLSQTIHIQRRSERIDPNGKKRWLQSQTSKPIIFDN